MTYIIVNFLTDENGDEEINDETWHLSVHYSGAYQALCSGQIFHTEFSPIKFRFVQVTKGGITCEKCLEQIRKFKKIKI